MFPFTEALVRWSVEVEVSCVEVSFLIMLQAWNFVKKEPPTQVFFCEFREIFNFIFPKK